jgi:hypothetical protein
MYRVALYLLKENPIEVLRRLAVICVEDAVLPPAYPALVTQICSPASTWHSAGRA